MQKYDPLIAETYDRVRINGTWVCGFQEAARVLGDIRGKQILDYGSGTGRSTRFLAELGGKATGVDIDPDMVRKAKILHPDLEFQVLSEEGVIPADDKTFDLALSSFVHVMISDAAIQQRIANEVYRVLKPGGKFVILTANPGMWGQEYESFLSRFPPDFTGKSGEPVYVMLKEEQPIDGYDHFWTEEDNFNQLRQAGFKGIGITKPESIGDLSPIPPFMVIQASKL